MTDELKGLKQYGTPRQGEVIDAVVQHGGIRAAARALGIDPKTVRKALASVRSKAALKGYAPNHGMTHTVPDPFSVKRVSTMRDGDGNIRAQWVIGEPDKDKQMEAFTTFVEGLIQDVRGRSIPVELPALQDSDLLAVYPMGDPHFGMYAWAAETGSDFDLTIAEALTRAAIIRLVEQAPPAETAVIVNLGDFFHADDSRNETPHGKNKLDVDGRYEKVMQVGLRAMVFVIEQALTKHRNVIVRNVKGNHDPHASFALALALDAYFSNQPRVRIDLTPNPFWFYRFGDVLIGATHGDGIKVDALLGVMAHDQAMNWGETKHRYWYCGHVHHSKVQELVGVTVEYFRTLASGDAWHTSKGYRSGRDMRCIVMHRQHGEVERYTANLSQLKHAVKQ